VLTVEDIARAGHEVALSLGVKRAAAVIGPSLGGMTVLAYCALFPDEARGVVSISAAARSTPFAIALRSLQREIIRRDPLWQEGTTGPMPSCVRHAAWRKLGMITYRSAKEWALRFGRGARTQSASQAIRLASISKSSRISKSCDEVHRAI
jgi:homoserine acetyltransferase